MHLLQACSNKTDKENQQGKVEPCVNQPITKISRNRQVVVDLFFSKNGAGIISFVVSFRSRGLLEE